ncbi:MAG: Dyp-type peroxidase [Microbacterium sp.]|jgi:dye decolorizing peroxidase|nr:Dyp-type peroxidase [Microbacterium sp.]
MSRGASGGPEDERHGRSENRISRRGLLIGAGAGLGFGVLGGGVAATVVGGTGVPASSPAPEPTRGGRVPSRGATQAGIARPATPQTHGLVVVADLPGVADAGGALTAIAALGEAVDAATDPERADPLVLPDGVGDLTVTIGIGPRLVRMIDPALPGAAELPLFAGDASLAPDLRGGDILIAVYASDAAAIHPVADAVLTAVPEARRRWAQQGVRGAGTGTVVRNPLGYHDGVIVPRSEDELATNVWIPTGAAAGGTVAVVRRLRLDVGSFHALPPTEQDRVIGRSRRDGAPLSGGELHDDADLTAKTPEGEYRVPLRSHVRAAHPSFTGSALMLRRGYGFSNAVAPGQARDDGLLFMCFQNDLDVFVRTQQRLDETDDLMRFAIPTASASFLILPGRTGAAALGSTLS